MHAFKPGKALIVSRSNGMNDRSNDELVQQLFRRDPKKQPERPAGYASVSANAEGAPEPLASRKEPFDVGKQTWTLGPADTGDEPINERERQALFAALNKGTRANLGREPTVAELIQLVEQVNHAREMVRAARQAIEGSLSVFIENDGRFHFRRPAAAARREERQRDEEAA
jgi:hypothetical protein